MRASAARRLWPGYYPNFGGPLASISYQKGVAWEVDGSPSISVRSWGNRGDLSTPQATPFRTIIAAKNAPFPDPLQKPNLLNTNMEIYINRERTINKERSMSGSKIASWADLKAAIFLP